MDWQYTLSATQTTEIPVYSWVKRKVPGTGNQQGVTILKNPVSIAAGSSAGIPFLFKNKITTNKIISWM